VSMIGLKKGSKGMDVVGLQKILGIKADGKFGPITQKHLKTFQKANGLYADGVVGIVTNMALLGQLVPFKRPPDNKQYDSRWGTKPYTSTGNKAQTIRSSGCGPTAMCDVVNAFVDKSITPVDLCKIAVAKGYRTANSGTSWSFFPYMASRYSAYFKRFLSTADHNTAVKALAEGALIVASMGKGFWTSQGHFICLWKMDGRTMYACDPASSTRKSQLMSKFRKERKRYFIFWPESKRA